MTTHRILTVSLQVRYGKDWVSSNIPFPRIKLSTPRIIHTLSIPRLGPIFEIGHKALNNTARKIFMTSLTEGKPKIYRLVKSDTLKEPYEYDEASLAIASMRHGHLTTFRIFSSKGIECIRFVGIILSYLREDAIWQLMHSQYRSHSLEMDRLRFIEKNTAVSGTRKDTLTIIHSTRS